MADTAAVPGSNIREDEAPQPAKDGTEASDVSCDWNLSLVLLNIRRRSVKLTFVLCHPNVQPWKKLKIV